MRARGVALAVALLSSVPSLAAPHAGAVVVPGPGPLPGAATVAFVGEFAFGFDAYPGADGVGLCEPGMDPYADCAIPRVSVRSTDSALDAHAGGTGTSCAAVVTASWPNKPIPACELHIEGSVNFPETGPTCAAFEGQFAGPLRMGARTGELVLTATAVAGGGVALVGGYVTGKERYAVVGYAALAPAAAGDCVVEPATSFTAVGTLTMGAAAD